MHLMCVLRRTFVSQLGLTIFSVTAALSADLTETVTPQDQQPDDKRWEMLFDSQVRYFTYKNTFGFDPRVAGTGRRPGKGSQLYLPFAAQLIGRPVDDIKVEMFARGGYVRSRQTTPFFSGEYVGPTDTQAGGTFTYLGIPGVQPFLSLNVNLPTGETPLQGNSSRARLDPDYVDVPTFGEGWNYGATVGANIPITESLVLNTSVGYVWRGEYDIENAFFPELLRSFDPGNTFTLSGSLNYQSGRIFAQLATSYTIETTSRSSLINIPGDFVIGNPDYELGNRFLLQGRLSYLWTEDLSMTLTLGWSHTSPNKVSEPQLGQPLAPLLREDLNSNSNIYRIGLDGAYRITSNLTAGPTASFLYRDENAYLPTTSQFVPAKRRWSLGAVANFAVSDIFTLNARLERVWTREGAQGPFVDQFFSGEALPQQSGHGWQASTGITARF
ncbi:transporter [Microvirga pakistanensis]|uniref:transporter n=1 Tax=Microvirga pakistanensis TaxID=1682650 RepID=UPI00106B0FA5|nr:hypothetical protein [Microvirga pakistanensis]